MTSEDIGCNVFLGALRAVRERPVGEVGDFDGRAIWCVDGMRLASAVAASTGRQHLVCAPAGGRWDPADLDRLPVRQQRAAHLEAALSEAGGGEELVDDCTCCIPSERGADKRSQDCRVLLIWVARASAICVSSIGSTRGGWRPSRRCYNASMRPLVSRCSSRSSMTLSSCARWVDCTAATADTASLSKPMCADIWCSIQSTRLCIPRKAARSALVSIVGVAQGVCWRVGLRRAARRLRAFAVGVRRWLKIRPVAVAVSGPACVRHCVGLSASSCTRSGDIVLRAVFCWMWSLNA